MAETSLPFNSQIVNQDQWELYHAPLMEGVIYGSPGGPVAQVYADSSGRQVKRRAGSGWVHGSEWSADTELLVPISANTASTPRIDRVVLRRDNTSRNVTTVVLVGANAVSPLPPGLTQNWGGQWEESLAQVYVDPGVVTIANGKVTDERVFNGTRLWRPSALSLLPVTNVPLWQEAVMPDGTKYRWNGTGWVSTSAWSPFTPQLAQVGPVALTSGSAGTFRVREGDASYNASMTTAAPSPGSGRLTLALPIYHAQVSSQLGTFTLDSPSPIGTLGGRTSFQGVAIQYAGNTQVALRDYSGVVLGDSPYSGVFPAGTTIHLDLPAYKAA